MVWYGMHRMVMMMMIGWMDGYCREEIGRANRSSGTMFQTSLCKGKVIFECIWMYG